MVKKKLSKKHLFILFIIFSKRLRWSRGSVLAFGTTNSRVQTRPKPSDFSGRKNPQHAFLRRGSKSLSRGAVLRHVKEP
jgi:hypothetical protein